MDRKILIIKDEDCDIRELITILEDEYNIIIYRSEQNMADVLKKEAPCTILIDSSFLEKKGMRLIEHIKKQKKVVDIPIMFVVDNEDYEIQKRLAEVGNIEYITRPYIPEIIRTRIHAQSELYLLLHEAEEHQKEQRRSHEMIEVKFLGEFSIKINDVCINAEMNRSKKMWQMLQYLITYRDRQVTGQELIEVLWPDEQVEKPAFALKTLSYRMRKQLEKLQVPYAKDLIQSVDGGYVWNNEYPCEVDTNIFENVCRQAEESTLSLAEKMVLWEKAVQLYKGDYFICSGLEHWMLHIQTYYYNLWLSAANNLMKQLSISEDYDKLIDICTQCIQHDKLNENFQYYFIWALMKKENTKEVIDYYEHLVELFEEELGTKPTKKIEQLYMTAILAEQQSENVIKQYQKQKNKKAVKPYFCDIDTFKSLYEIEQQRMKRSGKENYLIYFGLEELENERIGILHHAIMESLRASDVVTCINNEKYLILIQEIVYEQCEVIVERIFSKIDTVFHDRIKYSIQQVLQNKSLGF